ncbi:MAG: DnaJ domain-containing protein [Bacteroidetes bacterium]|nr:DnaJ domain-containing protein [Bacteroidota bacterium]
MEPDYYQILAISRTASMEQIKLSFHSLAKLYHPDVSADADAEKKFKEISMAYNTLVNPKKKSKYDLKLKYGTVTKSKSDENYKDFRKYGTRDKSRDYSDSYQSSHQNQEFKKTKVEIVLSDKFLFGSLVVAGIITIIFGVVDMFFTERDADEPIRITGLLFGIIFTSLLILGWKSMKAD